MKKTRILTLILGMLLAVSLFAGCGDKPAEDKGSSEQKIKATLTLVYEDTSTKDFELTAKSDESLADAMYAAEIISQKEYNDGYVTQIDGTLADYNKDQAWWCLQDKDGNQLSTGIKDVKLKDGDVYKFVYTKGF